MFTFDSPCSPSLKSAISNPFIYIFLVVEPQGLAQVFTPVYTKKPSEGAIQFELRFTFILLPNANLVPPPCEFNGYFLYGT